MQNWSVQEWVRPISSEINGLCSDSVQVASRSGSVAGRVMWSLAGTA